MTISYVHYSTLTKWWNGLQSVTKKKTFAFVQPKDKSNQNKFKDGIYKKKHSIASLFAHTHIKKIKKIK